MKQIILTFENDNIAAIASLLIEDALGGYSSPKGIISSISRGIDYDLELKEV